MKVRLNISAVSSADDDFGCSVLPLVYPVMTVKSLAHAGLANRSSSLRGDELIRQTKGLSNCVRCQLSC
jgi:hypothetical protein